MHLWDCQTGCKEVLLLELLCREVAHGEATQDGGVWAIHFAIIFSISSPFSDKFQTLVRSVEVGVQFRQGMHLHRRLCDG